MILTKKEILKSTPWLPLSSVIFVLIVVLFSHLGIIPPPNEILIFLGEIYQKFGLIGVAIASFLEGLVYLGLYFPGSMVIVMSLFVSGGTALELLKIALVVGAVFTLTSTINYGLGRILSKNEKHEQTGKLLFFSMLHPHFISFYFFNEGLEKKLPYKILVVPFFITVYIFAFALLLAPVGSIAVQTLGDDLNLILLMSIWFFSAFILNVRKEIKKKTIGL